MDSGIKLLKFFFHLSFTTINAQGTDKEELIKVKTPEMIYSVLQMVVFD